ncbi:VOC family protein [Rudaeicoccus suwonensis]|uniref:VOC domain-containing protein n=1 Tax=Rudaeicoccus suwonensis TaxID=657409 RepID=A0A561EB63_9MICO|nr:VOC family protein [Rudaeicoccus suwonensis]TWE12846.1 hypothetical protein BKA23_1666 [Rudaeicoccus suwonensis]
MTIDLTAPGTAVGVLASVSLECADTVELADFYRRLFDGSEFFRAPDGSVICISTGTVYLTAMRVAGYVAPTWPAPGAGGIVHLDVAVDDLAQSVERTIALGATEADHQPQPALFRVMLDPAGHPFCLTTARP